MRAVSLEMIIEMKRTVRSLIYFMTILVIGVVFALGASLVGQICGRLLLINCLAMITFGATTLGEKARGWMEALVLVLVGMGAVAP